MLLRYLDSVYIYIYEYIGARGAVILYNFPREQNKRFGWIYNFLFIFSIRPLRYGPTRSNGNNYYYFRCFARFDVRPEKIPFT